MSPEMVSLTVQWRVRAALPATNGSSSETTASATRESAGTGQVAIHVSHNNIYMYICYTLAYIPSTCISTVSVYVVSPAMAIHTEYRDPVL